MKNPKTTITGILMIAVALGSAGLSFMQGHSVDTTTTLATVMAGIGLIHASDSKKGQ
jgi:hypothetical protein